MSKSEYTVEDFVLDPEFKRWVLCPDAETKIYWEAYLQRNPYKKQELFLARKVLLNISRVTGLVDEKRVKATWSNIEKSIDQIKPEEFERKIIPLDSHSSFKKYPVDIKPISSYIQLYRMIGILALVFMLAVSLNYLSQPKEFLHSDVPKVYQEHIVPPGVKSNLTLMDGSKVILNSGSSLRYIKNFEPHQREVELIGEAYFEVSKSQDRPFIVKTGNLSTQVLGTSFNVKAFENEVMEVSLFTGIVEVKVDSDIPQKISLVPGEAVRYLSENQNILKTEFDKDKVMAWTQKVIVFDKTKMNEIKRVLENWYGVDIQFLNKPAKDLEISARFNDQSLKDVLEGLSYSARFDYEIQNEKVFLKFK